MMEQKIRIILTDDHRLVRQGLRALLAELDFVEITGEAADGRQLLALLRQGVRADVILLDVDMPQLDGLQTLDHLARDFFGVKAIMLTMINDRSVVAAALERGARGFLFKDASLSELNDAICRVAAGDTYFAGNVALTLLQASTPPTDPLLRQLTDREIEVLKLVAEGFSSTEIGQRLFISPRTVDTHRNHLIQKLQVNGIAGLVRFAIQHKLV